MAACEHCAGTGTRRIGEHKIEILCNKCHGSGEVKGFKTVPVEEIQKPPAKLRIMNNELQKIGVSMKAGED
jgi:DnaJ-class molecular chaperone